MVTLSFALEEVKAQLTEAVRSSLEKGFELVAGVVGGKLAKSVDAAIKNAELNVKKSGGGGGGGGELAGLREQIKENALVLFPLMDHATSAIHLITQGMPSTGGIRALLLDGTADPPTVMWSRKHDTVVPAMHDLLGVTQSHLKLRIDALLIRSPPVGTHDADNPSFDVRDDKTATADHVTNAKLLWDSDMHTNPGFRGFDYAAFTQRHSPDSDATVVDPWI